MRGEIVFTRAEIKALHTFMIQSSKARTYRVQRDSRSVLVLLEPSGSIRRLTPDYNASTP